MEASIGAGRSESRAMTTAAPILDVTDSTFDAAVIAASSVRPVVVDFWAGWCAPCRTLGPILEQAVALHGAVTLAKLDVDANPEVTARFGIQGIPAVKGFRDGQLVAEFVGLQPRAQVERFLDHLAPAPAPPPPPSCGRRGGWTRLTRCWRPSATIRCATGCEPGSRSAGAATPRWPLWPGRIPTPRCCTS